jgi:acyl carrier protein
LVSLPNNPETLMGAGTEAAAREHLARLLDSDIKPDDINLDTDMADGYGLTSLKKVVFLMALCDDEGVDLSVFTEPDVAAMRTLGDVTRALTPHVGTAA